MESGGSLQIFDDRIWLIWIDSISEKLLDTQNILFALKYIRNVETLLFKYKYIATRFITFRKWSLCYTWQHTIKNTSLDYFRAPFRKPQVSPSDT